MSKKNQETLGAAFRFAFKVITEECLKKGLYIPREDIFTIDTSKSSMVIGLWFSCNSTVDMYKKWLIQKMTTQFGENLGQPSKN